MGRLIDLTGKRFGRLTVIGRSAASETDNKRVFWDCICDCGKTNRVDGWNLRCGNVQSCGCLFIDRITKHGDYTSRLYKVFCSMKDRCNNPKNPKYAWYGGKGIKICKNWNTYAQFKKWAISSGYKEGLSIDRIDSNAGYCPENCRWVTRSENSTRTAKNLLTVNGVTKNYRQWEDLIGIGKMSIEHWVERHGKEYAIKRIDATLNPGKYSAKEIDDLGVHKHKRKFVSIDGETLSLSAWAKKIGRPHVTVLYWARNYGEQYTIDRIRNELKQ